MSLLPSTRIVRAFANVPVEAFRLIVDRETRTADDGLAVPLAGMMLRPRKSSPSSCGKSVSSRWTWVR
jgi:hypothetical protein